MHARASVPFECLAHLLVILLLGCAAFDAPSQSKATHPREERAASDTSTPTSILSLVANCEVHAGSLVATGGFLVYGEGRSDLCPTTELGRLDPLSCLELNLQGIELDASTLATFNQDFLIVDGLLTCPDDRLKAGMIQDILSIVEFQQGRAVFLRAE